MLFTESSGWAASLTTAPSLRLVLFGAVAHRVPELLALFHRGRFELRADDLLHGLDPVGDDVPLLAVPLLDQHRPAALVVLAGHLHRVGEALEPDLVQAGLGEAQVLVAPADLLGGQRLVAVLGHRGPEGLGEVHRVDDTPVVERLADLVLGPNVLSL